MYKTIVVPLDGSKRAEAILPHVVELAQRYEARVVFVRILEPIPYITRPEGAPDILWQDLVTEWQAEALAYMDARVREFGEQGIPCKAEIIQGPVVKAITDTAEKEDADLIAMASHGRTGLSQAFYGSVTAGVLQRVDRPLLVIRSRPG